MTPPVLPPPVLAIDLGGTKTLVGLVQDGACHALRRIETEGADPLAWLDRIAAIAGEWPGKFAGAAIAVTGIVADGTWSSPNPAVLPIPAGFPLVAELQRRLGVAVFAANDAQAAAWGEHRFGAGRGQDIAFVTLSTGIGAGFVLGGRLWSGRRGLAGHLGHLRCGEAVAGPWLEDLASGSALARQAASLDHDADAVGMFAAARSGAAWAVTLVAAALARIAAALATLHALIDPDCIVIGGGIGLAPGVLQHLEDELASLPPNLRPILRRAALGTEAGLLGIADLSLRATSSLEKKQ